MRVVGWSWSLVIAGLRRAGLLVAGVALLASCPWDAENTPVTPIPTATTAASPDGTTNPASPTGTATATVTIGPSATPTTTGEIPTYGYRIVATYPHDPNAYTQGLDFADGVLYEGTGLEGQSSLRRVDLETGAVIQQVDLANEHFGEGIVVLGEHVYQLTWQSQLAFVYDRESFELLDTVTYPTDGWGLTSDGQRLIMSDGSNILYFRDPETFAETRRVEVMDAEGEPVMALNELEWVDGEVWANIYGTDLIVRIDPDTGAVTGWIDLAGLLQPEDQGDLSVDVLNGIALNEMTGQLYVTGKLWPALYEIELVAP